MTDPSWSLSWEHLWFLIFLVGTSDVSHTTSSISSTLNQPYQVCLLDHSQIPQIYKSFQRFFPGIPISFGLNALKTWVYIKSRYYTLWQNIKPQVHCGTIFYHLHLTSAWWQIYSWCFLPINIIVALLLNSDNVNQFNLTFTVKHKKV